MRVWHILGRDTGGMLPFLMYDYSRMRTLPFSDDGALLRTACYKYCCRVFVCQDVYVPSTPVLAQEETNLNSRIPTGGVVPSWYSLQSLCAGTCKFSLVVAIVNAWFNSHCEDAAANCNFHSHLYYVD